MIHALKQLPEYFESVKSREKRFELRKNDRDFKVGDFLALNEWDPDLGYTGRSVLAVVVYLMDPNEVMECVGGFALMGIELVDVVALPMQPPVYGPGGSNELCSGKE